MEEEADFVEQRDDLLQSIEKDRQEIRVAMHELTSAAGFRPGLRERIRDRPLAWMLGAFLVGTWLGSRSDAAGAAVRRRSR